MKLNNHLSSLPQIGCSASSGASTWLIVPGQAAKAAKPSVTINPMPVSYPPRPGLSEQSLVFIAVLFAVVALVGILAWFAAIWKLLDLFKAQNQTQAPNQPVEAGGTAAPGKPKAAVAAMTPGSAITATETTTAEKPASTPRAFSHLLPDFLYRADFQDYGAAIFNAEGDASHGANLLIGNLVILNAAVKASERLHYHDSMLETALRGIGACVANLNRKPNLNQPIGDLLTWEKQIQAFLSTTTEYGLRTPMPGEKVDNDWMSAPPRSITVSAVDCWAIYKRNDVVCKALVH